MYMTLGIQVLNFMVNHIEGRHFEETSGQLSNFIFCVYIHVMMIVVEINCEN